jgi:hypothetical protein
MYIELKSHPGGHNDNGPAWITRIIFSKSGKSIYFHGKLLKRGSSGCSNYYDSETGEEYWVSGPKKDGTDRYPWAHNKVFIEEDVCEG